MTNQKNSVVVKEEELCPWVEKCSHLQEMEDDLEKFYNELVNMNLKVNILNHYLDTFSVALKGILSEIQNNIDSSFETLFPNYDISDIPTSLEAENAEYEVIDEDEESQEEAEEVNVAEKTPDIAKLKAQIRNEYLAMIWDICLEELKNTRTVLV